MADTGAPYFIPYVEPTDLVRDYPAADEASADAIAAALDAIPVLAGIGSNVVQAVKTDVFTSTTTSFVPVPGLSVTITPSSATSKVLIIAQVVASNSVSDGSIPNHFRIVGGNASGFIGDAAGSRQRATFGGTVSGTFSNAEGASVVAFLDSPATANAVTYTIEMIQSAGFTGFVNRTLRDDNQVRGARYASSITAIEVAA